MSKASAGNVLTTFAVVAVAALAAGLLLQQEPAPIWRHVLFAAGILPLILVAMLYFVPVLTRSPPAHAALLLPAAALLSGIAAVASFSLWPHWLPVVAGVAALIVALELVWVWRRRRAALGGVHAGVDWYLWALAALLAALLLIAARGVWPQYWAATRVLHLHLNLFGFLGLTAIGTLRVLLPTATGARDPLALAFLRRQLPIAVAGAAAIALGAAYWRPLAMLGALAWAWPSVQLLNAVGRAARSAGPLRGAGLALGAAALGWLTVLLAGIAHGLGLLSADAALSLLIYLFLLPLVTGATSHLLPVWRWPGAANEAQARMRAALVSNSGVRVAAFWSSAVLEVAGIGFAAAPAVLAVLAYLPQVLLAFARVRPAGARPLAE